MADPTQTPPFAASCRVTDGVVTEMTGWANQHWADANGALLIPDGLPVAVGWGWDGSAFIAPATPETLPTEGTTP